MGMHSRPRAPKRREPLPEAIGQPLATPPIRQPQTGPRRQRRADSSRHSSCSIGSPPWCRRHGSTATATSASWRPTYPCALRSPPSRRQPRRHHPHPPPTRNPPPNRPTDAPPATPGRCCSPVSTKSSRGVPSAARCGSSPSSPTRRPCATSSSTSVSRSRHPRSAGPWPTTLGMAARGQREIDPAGPAHTGLRVRSARRPVVNRDRPSSVRDDGPARACGRHARPARTSAGASHPRNAGKHPHGDAQPLHLPVGPPASTRDTLPQQTPHAVGLPIRRSNRVNGKGSVERSLRTVVVCT